MGFAERQIDPDRRCFMYCGDAHCTCGLAERAIIDSVAQAFRGDMEKITGKKRASAREEKR